MRTEKTRTAACKADLHDQKNTKKVDVHKRTCAKKVVVREKVDVRSLLNLLDTKDRVTRFFAVG